MFKFSTLVLWNVLTKRKVLDLRDPTLGVVKEYYERRGALDATNEFDDMISQELPTTIQERREQEEMYES